MMKKITYFLLVILAIGYHSIIAQSHPKIDSLEQILIQKQIPLTLKLKLYNNLAQLYNQNMPSAKGIEHAQKAIQLAQKLNDLIAEGLAYNHWGDLHSKVNDKDWQGAITYYQKALVIRKKIVKQYPDSLERRLDMALTLSDIAYAYWRWGKLNKALENYKASLNIAEKIYQIDPTVKHIEGFIGLRKNNMGAIYWAQSKYKEALDYYLEALKIYEKIDYPGRINLVLTNIGMIYFRWQQYDKAQKTYQEAIGIARRIQHAEGLGYAQNNMGKLFEEKKQYDSAMVYFQKSAENYRNTKDIGGIGMNLNSLGNLYQKIGKYNKAKETYQESLKISNENQSRYWQAITTQNLASLSLQTKEWQALEKNIEISQMIALEEGYKDIVKDNYLIKSKFYENTQQPEKALAQHKLFVMMKDSIFSEEKFKEINRIQAQYEFEKEQKENEILKREAEIQEKNLKRSQYEKMALSFFLLLLLTFAVYVWSSRQKLQISHKQLTLRKEEIDQQKEVLTQQAQQLEEVNEVKDRLFSIVAHDLKSPIAQLEAVMGLIQDGHLSESELKRILPEINKNISYTSDLVNNLLHWAKSQMQGMSIELASFDIQKLVQQKIDLLEKTAQQKNISVYNQINTNTIVFADPDMVDLVLRNLISNALKFCFAKDTIKINAVPTQQHICISIEDTGQGIPEEYLPSIFENQNFSTKGTANEKGTGLGLSLCKDFIEKNGGEIWVESSLGEGSTFYFTLPRANIS